MKKRSTGADGANLRQVVVEQPKKMVKKKEMSIEDNLGTEEEKSNKSSILDGDGVRRRGGTSSTVGTDMMDEIDDIMRDDGGSTLGDKVIMLKCVFVKLWSTTCFCIPVLIHMVYKQLNISPHPFTDTRWTQNMYENFASLQLQI